MTDKLSDIEARIGSVRQLDAVIKAMRGMAAARSREARERLDGIRTCASMIGVAIGEALVLVDKTTAPTRMESQLQGHAVIALCSEQGFVGTFNERILDRSRRYCENKATQLLLVGDRGAMVAAEREVSVSWFAPMAAHPDEVVALANRLTEALYERLETARVTHVTMVYAMPSPSMSIDVTERALLPFDFSRFQADCQTDPRNISPLVTMPPQRLLGHLAQEYVYAQLCEALMLSFAAENEARMRAMIAARSNVQDKLTELIDRFRCLRQEQITSEIIELSADNAALPARHRQTTIRQ